MKLPLFSRICLKGRLMALVVAIILAFAPGCANYQVRIPSSDPSNKDYQGTVMHGLFWGAWMSPEILAVCQQEEAINDVVAERNYLYDLASVVTLGIWMPLEIKFRCRAPDIDAGIFQTNG